jgi:hypothetical protein
MLNWLNGINSTNTRILVTLFVTIATAARYLWIGIPGSGGVSAFDSWLMFVAVMAGIDASQYVGKRFSDSGYAAAKYTPPAPVNISTPSPVTVAPGATSADVDVRSTNGGTSSVTNSAPNPAPPTAPQTPPRGVDLLGDAARLRAADDERSPSRGSP